MLDRRVQRVHTSGRWIKRNWYNYLLKGARPHIAIAFNHKSIYLGSRTLILLHISPNAAFIFPFDSWLMLFVNTGAWYSSGKIFHAPWNVRIYHSYPWHCFPWRHIMVVICLYSDPFHLYSQHCPERWRHGCSIQKGFHLADIVMPFFLFMVGVSLSLSMRRVLNGAPRRAMYVYVDQCKMWWSSEFIHSFKLWERTENLFIAKLRTDGAPTSYVPRRGCTVLFSQC